MMRVIMKLQLLLIFLTNIVVHSTHIAVCVGGQLGRLFPDFLVKDLVQANPSVHFTIFITVQHNQKNRVVYNTDAHLSFHSTPVGDQKLTESLDYLFTAYLHDNSRLHSVRFLSPLTMAEWQQVMGDRPDRIEQYVKEQDSILNMYRMQENCFETIAAEERLHNTSFDLVISTREDAYYFKPLNVSVLLPLLKSTKGGECDMVSKNCLEWGGLNMRWQLMTREAASKVIGKRMEYYHFLRNSSKLPFNPERFELWQTRHYGVSTCQKPVDVVPVAVVRHLSNGTFCFPKYEVMDNCFPAEMSQSVNDMQCDKFRHMAGQKHFR